MKQVSQYKEVYVVHIFIFLHYSFRDFKRERLRKGKERMREEEKRFKELLNKRLIHRYLDMFLELYEFCYVVLLFCSINFYSCFVTDYLNYSQKHVGEKGKYLSFIIAIGQKDTEKERRCVS